MTELLAATIAALGGAFAGYWAQTLFAARAQRAQRKRVLGARYLAHLQDALQSLWHRLQNVTERNGRSAMTRTYFEHSMIYAIGRALACERALILDGQLVELANAYPELGNAVSERAIHKNLSPLDHYNRLALAESMLVRGDTSWRIETFPEFIDRWTTKTPTDQEWSNSIKSWLASADDAVFQNLMRAIEPLIENVSKVTRVRNSTTTGRSKVQSGANDAAANLSVDQVDSCLSAPSPRADSIR